MLCDVCQKRPAKIFLTEIVNGKKTEQHLCEQCASEHTAFPIGNIGDSNMQIGSILSGILTHYMNGGEREEEGDKSELETRPQEPVCQQCGMTETEVLKYGRLGCSVCYSTFADIISKNVKATQGGTEHCGKEPRYAKMVAVEDMVRVDAENIKEKKKPVKKGRKTKKPENEIKADPILEEADRYDQESSAEFIEQLKKDLKAALDVEDYKEAAHLRDTIRYFEGKENEKKEE